MPKLELDNGQTVEVDRIVNIGDIESPKILDPQKLGEGERYFYGPLSFVYLGVGFRISNVGRFVYEGGAEIFEGEVANRLEEKVYAVLQDKEVIK